MSDRPTHLKDLQADPQNARKHTQRNIGTIVDALHEVGAARSIVIDEDNVVIAGNGTVEAAAEAGITKVQVVEADGETVVAVRRRGLSAEQKRRLALFDNRTSELAEWDADVLRQMVQEGADLSGLWRDDELAKLLAEDQAASSESLEVARPSEVVWLLVALPVEHWPAHQAAIEAVQADAEFYGSVLRAREAPQTTKALRRAREAANQPADQPTADQPTDQAANQPHADADPWL